MKKFLSIILISTSIFSLVGCDKGSDVDSPGDNTDPVIGEDGEIIDSSQLHSMELDGDYILGADINLAGFNWQPIGTEEEPFTGSLDGNGYTISNLAITLTSESDSKYSGFIGYSDNATLTNLIFNDVNVATENSENSATGVLVGYATNTTITNTTITGSVNGRLAVGGIAGSLQNSIIEDTNSSATVSGTSKNIGGLVGILDSSTISNSYTTGTVSGVVRNTGGLIGSITNASITNSYSTSIVNGESTTGGLIGYSENSTIEETYATGETKGSFTVGGLIGNSVKSTVTKSYASGNIEYHTNSDYGKENIGGLIGSAGNASIITETYATGSITNEATTSGYKNVGGLIGILAAQSILSDSYATGNVTGTNSVGGLVGQNTYAYVINTYATGNVDGYMYIGGLIGYQFITSCNEEIVNQGVYSSYATGNVSGFTAVGATIGSLLNEGCQYVFIYEFEEQVITASGLVNSYGIIENFNTISESWFTTPENWNTFYPWDETIWDLTDLTNNGPKLKFTL